MTENSIPKNYVYRVCYSRIEEMAFISHLDFVEVLRRSILRSNLPVFYTQGFHSLIKMAFSQPVGLGVESEAEFVDIFLVEQVDPQIVCDALKNNVPSGILINEVNLMHGKVPPLDASFDYSIYEATIHSSDLTNINFHEIVKDFLKLNEIVLSKMKKQGGVKKFVSYNARPHLENIKFIECSKSVAVFEITLLMSSNGSTRIENIFSEFVKFSGIKNPERCCYKKLKMIKSEKENGKK